jgi:RHS repeat-associated protein
VEAYLYQAYGLPTVVRPGDNEVMDWGLDDEVVAEWSGIETASMLGNPFLYTGQPYDADVGLYYYRARYYDPNEGRFLSRDPIGVWGDTSNLGNAYAYVMDDPINLRDPSGRYIESGIDLASLALGWWSFMDNVENERWGWAALDVAGMIVDGVALALPIIPGGAGFIISGVKNANKAADFVNGLNKVEDVAPPPRLYDDAAQGAVVKVAA